GSIRAAGGASAPCGAQRGLAGREYGSERSGGVREHRSRPWESRDAERAASAASVESDAPGTEPRAPRTRGGRTAAVPTAATGRFVSGRVGSGHAGLLGLRVYAVPVLASAVQLDRQLHQRLVERRRLCAELRARRDSVFELADVALW